MFETGILRSTENHSARPGGVVGIYFRFLVHESMSCVLIIIASWRPNKMSTHDISFSIYKKSLNHRRRKRGASGRWGGWGGGGQAPQ